LAQDDKEILRLDRRDVSEVVDVLCESFHDYPVMRHVIGSESSTYDEKLRTLIQFFVMARVFRREIILGMKDGATLSAAALVTRPTAAPEARELAELREQVWSRLGTSARTRYEAFGAAYLPLMSSLPHIHLNMIGVRRAAQGKGFARKLLDHVQRLSREDPESRGVTLTTEDERNVPLYRHVGYELVGHVPVAAGLETWAFFRAD
jgi:GNAT superfamily N-acetyltransferase